MAIEHRCNDLNRNMVQKSLRVELGGGLPPFTSIREEVFSETHLQPVA